MLFTTLATVAALSQVISAADVHGASAQGTVMGPAAFMFPADRVWSASADNIAPCGSTSAPGNRSEFPLGASGKVSFSIADDTTNVILRVAYGNNPTDLSDFTTFQTVDEFDPGHQCYATPNTPSSVVAGSNGTFQLEYTGNDSGKEEKFYACADVTFVEAAVFSTYVNCFNVTADEFTPAGASPSSTGSTETAQETASPSVAPAVSSSSSGLSVAEKAGIAVSVIVGVFLIASVVFFMVRRKRSPAKDSETGPAMTKVASFNSADAAPRN